MMSRDESEFPAPFSLKGEVALVTGGGSGLGLAMVRCMVAAGARVAITGRRADVLQDAVTTVGSRVTAIPGDLRQLDTLPQLLAQVETRLGPLTILVNNAGIHLKRAALETSDPEFTDVIETHVSSAFALAREAGKVMFAKQRGNIIFVGSMASVMGIPDVSAYSAAKAAVIGLTRALAVEWGGHGIRVNAVVPGWIDTGMARQALEREPARKSRILSRTPLQHLGEPEDIGWAVVYLCSPAAKFVTGITLMVDGGAAIGF
jgi:gluconate 5-dehydrogenase